MIWDTIILAALLSGIIYYGCILYSAVECARRKNRNIPFWFVASLIFPISLLAVEFLKPLPNENGVIARSEPKIIEYFGMFFATITIFGGVQGISGH